MSEEEKLLKEAKKLPWEDRLSHKNWKVRNEANIDLAAVCDSITDPKDQRIREFGPLFRKTVADSNAPVQERSLDALIAFLRAADADAGRFAKDVCDAIVSKCFTGRPKTVEKAQTAFLLWVELEATEVFLDAMEKGIKNKVAKAVVPAIDLMFQALSEFGAKVVPPKRILKMLPELFDHPDQNVRASSKGLTLELCRWIGKDPVKSILFEKMRDTMKKELEAELVTVSGGAKPTRKIRSEQDKEPEIVGPSEAASSSNPEENVDEAPVEIDEYDLMDPVDILTPLEKSTFWDGVKATKWSERRDAVAELTKLASAKKILPGDFSEVARTLKKLATDVNIAVSVEAIQALGNLARGLRTHFSNSSRALLPVLLDKFKEKKPTILESLTQTLQAMHKAGCLNLADVVEDVKTATKNKVPSVRSLTLNWVTYCIETSGKAVVLKVHKDYVPACMECLNDGTPEVRDAAFSALAAMAKLVGMRPLERALEKLDDVKRKKLSEMIAGSPGDTESAASTATGNSSGGRMPSSEPSGGQARKSAASLLTGKKPLSSQAASKKGGNAKAGPAKKSDPVGRKEVSKAVEQIEDITPSEMSLEEIESRLGSLVEAETLALLKSAVWKERLEAITSLKTHIEGLEDIDSSIEILIRLLCAVPGWNEKNVQVQQQVVEVITHLASVAKKFPKKCIVLCLHGLSERVADIKTRVHAMKCLTTFSEAVGPGFVFDRLYGIMKEHKNPKVLSEGLLWMISAIEDFGISHLKLEDLIEFCKVTGLQSSVAATRNATIKLLGTLHKFVGPGIKGFLSDVKPALLSALDAEYEKNPFEGASSLPKKTVKSSDAAVSASSNGLDGLPREDISTKITPALLKNLESPDWKVRLESIEAVNKIVDEAHKRIQPTGTGELFGALRGRLFDSNKNLIMATLSTISAVATAMGPAVDKPSKGILSDVLKCLSDNKKQMRECTLSTLDSWFATVQLDKMIPFISSALLDNKLGAEGRKDLYDWLSKKLSTLSNFNEAIHLLKPAGAGMADKSADVRKAAEGCMMEIIRVCGSEMVEKSLRDLSGPALAFVTERVKPYGSVEESFAHPPKAAAKTLSKMGANAVSKHGSKANAPRGALAKSAIPMEDRSLQMQALLNVKDSVKEERERVIVRRFKFEELRAEQILELEVDVMKFFREDVAKRLLSSDFKRQVEALEILQKGLASFGKDIIEVLDVLFKWFVLQFCKSNTTCLLKVLEFLPELFHVLSNEGYVMNEAEASIFLPCLVEKLGHNIEKVRDKMRELTKQIIGAYTPTKTFPYITEGLRSKNNRTRIECVDLIGYLLEHHGAEIIGHLKSLQSVASLTAERDGEIRKAALNTLATGYKMLGDDVWKYVGKLTDAQRSMLDDRFKWKVREMEKRREGRPGDARAALRRAVRDNGYDAVEQSGEISHPLQPPPATDIHTPPQQSSGPTDWNEALDTIQHGSPEQSVDGMKFICHKVTQATNDPDGALMDALAKDADTLVACLAAKVPQTFDFSLSGASSRSCKYVLNTLMQTFQNKRLAHAVKESTLNSLISELLLWLLDDRVPHMDDGSQLLKALNVLMLKILDNADRTSSFVVLINLLRPLDPARWPATGSPDRNQKFSDLVVKCLIKLTKVLQSTIYDVDLDPILQSIHVYLQDLGMEEIRKRAGADDKPLRMVKTVLHELVKLRGAAIKGHLSMVPIDMKPPPIILAYIDLNLETLAAARMLTSTGPVGQTHWPDSGANNPPSSSPSADSQLKQELAAIFKKIGDKQTSAIGLYELFRITQLYPKVDIFSQLQNASDAFRTYIRDGLAQMEKNAAAGRAPASVPISAPPETRFGVENVFGDHRNDKYLPGVNGGTLDAIRERMKSMQIAAAGNGNEGTGPGTDGVSGESTVMPMDEKALSGLQARMERLKSGSHDSL